MLHRFGMPFGVVFLFGVIADPHSANATFNQNPGDRDGSVEVSSKVVIPGVSFADADLNGVVLTLQKSFMIDVVLEPAGEKPYGRVNVSLSNKTIDFVIRQVARSAGAFVSLEEGVYHIRPTAPEPQREVVAVIPVPITPEKRASHVERIRLYHANASDIKLILNGSFDDLQVAAARNALMNQNISPGFQKPFEGPKQPTILFPGGSGTSEKSTDVPPSVPTATPVRAPEEGQTPAGGSLGGGLGGGFGGRGGGTAGAGGGGQGGRASGGASSLLPQGIDGIIAYDVDNTLLVRYSDDESLRELKEVIRLLDVAPKQLMIKAEFIQVQQDDLRSFGIDWQISRGALTATSGQQASGNVQVNFAAGNVVAALRASLSEGRGRIVNSPMVTTTNNVPVTISIGTNVPVITNSVAFGNNGQGITVPNITTVQVSSGLTVFPRINGDNTVTMYAVPFVQDILSEVANPAGGTIPITTFQTVPVVRRIGNNETLVIGGLIKKNDRTSTSKIPLLGDLPLIGSLFRSRSSTVSDSELLVFITPTILPDPVSQSVPESQPRP